jgi:hypothetical protein
MLYTDFCEDFNVCLNKGDYTSANEVLMHELGATLVRRKKDFVHLLNESGVPGEMGDSDLELIDRFVTNVPYNKNLMVGASLLVNMQNKEVNFDGDAKLSDENVKNGYHVMKTYFIDENYSNAIDPVTAIAEGIGKGLEGGFKLGTSIQEGKNKKKYGGLDIAQKQQEAKQAMIAAALQAKQANLAAKQKDEENKAKTKKLVYLIGGSLLGLIVLGVTVYQIRKRK